MTNYGRRSHARRVRYGRLVAVRRVVLGLCAVVAASALGASPAFAAVGHNRAPAATSLIRGERLHGVALHLMRGRFIRQAHELIPTGATTTGCQPETTFAPPPTGFDPTTATPAQDEAYGFPPPPAGSDAVATAQWEQAMEDAKIDAATAPAADSTPTSCGGPDWTDGYSGVWAGIQEPATIVFQTQLTWAAGQWTFNGVPSDGSDNTGGYWVGTGNNALIQSGTGEEASDPARYWFWNEDYPGPVDNEGPAVHGGDVIYVETDYEGDDTALYYEGNESTGVYQSFGPSGNAPYDGNAYADFIYERQTGNGGGLPNFGSIPESGGSFGTDSDSYTLSSDNTAFSMTSNCHSDGTKLATPTTVNSGNGDFSVNYHTSGPVCDN